MSLIDDYKWLTTHLILVTVCAGLVYGGIYFVDSLVAKHDKELAAIYQQQNQQFQAQTKQEIDALLAQNASLEKVIQDRQATETKLPTVIGSLDAKTVAFDISKAANSKPNAVTVNNNEITLDLATAQTLLTDAELVPLLQQDKLNLQTAFANEQKIYSDEVAAHQKDNEANARTISALKSDARKGKLKWFGIGYVAGFISGVAVVVK